jgi:vitamin B12/bleomycin/antimicrobial peptide transport system ATP-binding/permease protein
MNASDTPSRTRFRFDKELWNRFVEIAQPYFYPLERGGTWKFFGLLLVLLISVIALAFFLAVGLTLLGKLLFSAFFTKLAAGLVAQVDGLLKSPAPYVAAGVLLVSTGIFVTQNRKLRQRWNQWGLLGFLLFMSFVVSGLNVVISFVFRFIDNALNEKQPEVFWQFLIVYGIILVVAIPILVGYRYLRLKLGLFWREWLTKNFLSRYFANRAYYDLDSNAANTEVDNPDQRITEDVRSFTSTLLSFLLELLDSILNLVAFTGILYSISKPLTIGLLVYTALGTAVAVIAGSRLIRINFDQLRLEANFRYGMIHIRDNAESIAFYRGENLEQRQVVDRLISALRNFDLLIIWQAIIDIFQYAYNYFSRLVPYVIVAPIYFSGQTDFGSIGQGIFAFSMVLSALSFIPNQIQQLTSFAAGINRLGVLHEKLNEQANPYPDDLTTAIETQITPGFSIENLTLRTPNAERTLIRELSLAVQPDQSLLIVGASGCGKSSLLRAIAGLWTNGSGTICRPDSGEVLFLPQRPYMLLGTLRDQLVYPHLSSDISEPDIQKALQLVRLDGLPERLGGLDVEKDWPTVLSLGEQQRLAFARILLTKPQYVMLDEATSALDIKNERNLYELLREMGLVYISVGHRPSLLDYHQTVLELDSEAGWQVHHTSDYRFAAV